MRETNRDLVRKTILDKQATTEAAFQQTKRKLSEAQEKLGEKNNEIDETKKSVRRRYIFTSRGGIYFNICTDIMSQAWGLFHRTM